MIVNENVRGSEKYKTWNDEVTISLASCGGNSCLRACLIQEEYALSNQHMDIVKFVWICHGDSFTW